MTANIAAAKAELSHLEVEEKDVAIKAASRDFFWYSPVLKARLDHVTADFVVRPHSEAEIIEILKTCYKHNVPVTTRGAGTGNYGQAMPLEGGCVMHLRHMDKVKEIHPGRVISEPGVLLKNLDAACKEHSGQEIRMFSSTWATATIGGFIAGGSGGVGSCTWGMLRDLGNIIRLRVVTMEENPRILEFRGEELARVSHAYGTNGIITEIEMPLAPAYDWVEMFIATDDFMDTARFAEELANEDGILIKLASVYEGPTAHTFFQRVQPYVDESTNLIGLKGTDGRMRVRGPGSIGTTSIATLAPRVMLFSWEHSPRRFVPTVDYVSVPGWHRRAAVGLDGGPTLCVTSMGVMDFQDGSMALRSVHPGVGVDELRDATSFELIVPDRVPTTPVPTPAELQALRAIRFATPSLV